MNLFNYPTIEPGNETFETAFENGNLKIERIVSNNHKSPPDFWFDQEQDEWVVIIQGSATLQFADQSELHRMQTGDSVYIAAHRKHRVEQTDAKEPTVWLAVHFDPNPKVE